MDFKLEINQSTCIKCGKCERICPAGIFVQDQPKASVRLHNESYCIKCGHCVAVCPTNSVIHSEFPKEKLHAVDFNLLPTPEQVMLLIKSRRSNRAFTDKRIPNQMLEQILEAAHRAPTAVNSQQVEFTLVTDPQKLQLITGLTIDIFAEIAKRLENFAIKPFVKLIAPQLYQLLPRFKSLQDEHQKGEDPILKKATALILIHTPKSSRFGCMDANLAYQNASLMAESLGVAQFYTGFLCSAIKQDRKDRLTEALGIQGQVHAGMALAIPEFRFHSFPDRQEIKVNRV
jgi:ferredoxin